MRLKCQVNPFRHHNWTRTAGLGSRESVSFQITFRAFESVISSDNNTSCVFMREKACSSMHNTFTPDSDSVYLAKGAVSLHDNVVTDGINARATHDIHSGRGTWEEGLQTMWRWSHDSGKESWCFFLRKIASYQWWLPSDQCKMNGWLHFPLSWALKALCKTCHAEPSAEPIVEAAMRGAELLIRTVIPSDLFKATPQYLGAQPHTFTHTRPWSVHRE